MEASPPEGGGLDRYNEIAHYTDEPADEMASSRPDRQPNLGTSTLGRLGHDSLRCRPRRDIASSLAARSAAMALCKLLLDSPNCCCSMSRPTHLDAET